MKKADELIPRSKYIIPTIEIIRMDKEISLTLNSYEAPVDPEASSSSPKLAGGGL